MPAADYGLNILDILRAPEKELNQVVGMKRLAPYREDAGRFRPNMTKLREMQVRARPLLLFNQGFLEPPVSALLVWSGSVQHVQVSASACQRSLHALLDKTYTPGSCLIYAEHVLPFAALPLQCTPVAHYAAWASLPSCKHMK